MHPPDVRVHVVVDRDAQRTARRSYAAKLALVTKAAVAACDANDTMKAG